MHGYPDGFGETDWLSQTLATHWPNFPGTGPTGDTVRAWVVGGVQDNETLVQARPVVRDPRASFVADFLRAPTHTTLAAHVVVPSGATAGPAASPPPLTMVRFQRWIGIRSEVALGPDEATATAIRSELHRNLPNFLIRNGPFGDRELVTLAFLAELHAAGELGKAYATAATIRGCLAQLDRRLGHPAHVHVMVSDGRTVGVLHRGGQLLSLTPPPPPPPPRAISQPHLRPSANLLLFSPGPGPDPSPDVVVVPDGIFTVHTRQPGLLDRG